MNPLTPTTPPLAPETDWIDTLKYNADGLIPAIAQDHRDGTVLMMAWMNAEAIRHTLATGEVHYWSRSRRELWHKGATSGHIQKLKRLHIDCDRDTILVEIEQIGGIACHTGARSCFFTEIPLSMTAERTLEEKLGYTFRNRALLDRALTSKAYALEARQQGEDCEDQEAFCVLGDAVLKLILVEALMARGITTRKDLTERKRDLESREGLAEVARAMDLGVHLRLGRGEQKQGNQRILSVLGETLEAIVAAIYLDGGYDVTCQVITKLLL